MYRITPQRLKQIKLKLKVAKAERTIATRTANAANKRLAKVISLVNKLEGKLNATETA